MAVPLGAALFLGGGSAAAAAGASAAPASALAASVLAAHLSTHLLSYLLHARAGPAFPERYVHADGGEYRGEWRGLQKEGLGVYSYPSGARYSGQWRAGQRDGRGHYSFPSGGAYEGEWSSGMMTGVGVRTYSTGKVVCGRFENGKMVAPLALWQCRAAAEGAAEAARAAEQVVVGGGTVRDAVRRIGGEDGGALVGAFVALGVLGVAAAGGGGGAAAGLVAAAASSSSSSSSSLLHAVPEALATVARALAPAHVPLALVAAGAKLSGAVSHARGQAPLLQEQAKEQEKEKGAPPAAASAASPPPLPLTRLLQPRHLADALTTLAPRLVCALLAASALLRAAAVVAAGGGGGATAQAQALATGAAVGLLGAVAPLPPAAPQLARLFRLSEPLSRAVHLASHAVGLPLMALVAHGAAAAGLVVGGGGAGAGSGGLAASCDAAAASLLLAAAGVAALAPALYERWRCLPVGQGVKMVLEVKGGGGGGGEDGTQLPPPPLRAAAVRRLEKDAARRFSVFMMPQRLETRLGRLAVAAPRQHRWRQQGAAAGSMARPRLGV